MSKSKTAIVTGAGSGIGKALTLLLSEAGWSVAGVGRSRDKLEQTAAQTGEAMLILDIDVTDDDAAARIVSRTLETFGHIDALAHVAGDALLSPIEQMTPARIRSCLLTNLGAAAELTAAVWPPLVADGGGVIAHVSSMASIDPFPGFSVYAAAKIGINMFVRATADEGEAHNIATVSVAPGAVETPMLRRLFDEATLPPDKTLDPRDVARVIFGCITGQRTFTSGETIVVASP